MLLLITTKMINAKNNKKEDVVNALTIDVEDYFHVSNFASIIPQETWKDYEPRVAGSTRKILAILDEHKTKATFFILGWVAERIPELVREIFEEGHEVASHGYEHQLIYEQGPDTFRSDVARSKNILEEITGRRVDGYRAPSFTITNETLWALEILLEEGYQYDSSVSPVQDHSRYGIPNANPYLHHIKVGEKGKLVEFPMSTAKVFGRRVHITGGGYLRLFPYSLVKWGINRINMQGHPAIAYLHPWELDPEQPRIEVDWFSRFRHYVNISKTEGKLRRLLNDFQFSTVQNVLDQCNEYKFATVHDYSAVGSGQLSYQCI